MPAVAGAAGGWLLLGISVLFWAVAAAASLFADGLAVVLRDAGAVSQLVTIGAQAMADRWTYVPSLGVLILVIWGAGELVRSRRYLVLMLSVAGVRRLSSAWPLTRQQLGYWKDSEALFRHTVAVTKGNYMPTTTLAPP
jgi:hypothetical protein